MKARPYVIIEGRYVECFPADATHLELRTPGPLEFHVLPIIIKGSRDNDPRHPWTWNGDVDKPTLKPSLLSKTPECVSHCWITDGKVQFLSDTTHEFKGQTVDLLDAKDWS